MQKNTNSRGVLRPRKLSFGKSRWSTNHSYTVCDVTPRTEALYTVCQVDRVRAFYMYIECGITSDTIGCIFLTQKTVKMSDGSGSWENHSIDEEKAFQGGTSEESEGSSDKGSSPDEREAEDVLWVHVVNQPGDDYRQAEDNEPNPDDRRLKTDW